MLDRALAIDQKHAFTEGLHLSCKIVYHISSKICLYRVIDLKVFHFSIFIYD